MRRIVPRLRCSSGFITERHRSCFSVSRSQLHCLARPLKRTWRQLSRMDNLEGVGLIDWSSTHNHVVDIQAHAHALPPCSTLDGAFGDSDLMCPA